MSYLNSETVARVTANIAAAALDPSKWQDVVTELHRASNGTRTHVFGHDLQLGRPVGLITEGYEEAFLKSFEEYYGSVNEWMPGFLSSGVGRIASSDQMVDFEHLKRTEFYNDWVLPQEDIISGGGAILFNDHDRFIAVGGNIRSSDREKTEAPFLELLRMVLPHLQCAFDTNRRLLWHSLNEHVANNLSDFSTPAVLLVDLDGRIKFACGNAERILSTGLPLSVDINGRLCDGGGRPLKQLKALQRDVKVHGRLPAPTQFLVHSGRAEAFETHLFGFEPGYLAVSPFGSLLGIDCPCVLVSISKLRSDKERLEHLAEHFGLTQAEAEVANHFGSGLSPAEISDVRAVSVATTRNQIRAVYSKLDVSGQLEVARIVDRTRRF